MSKEEDIETVQANNEEQLQNIHVSCLFLLQSEQIKRLFNLAR